MYHYCQVHPGDLCSRPAGFVPLGTTVNRLGWLSQADCVQWAITVLGDRARRDQTGTSAQQDTTVRRF